MSAQTTELPHPVPRIPRAEWTRHPNFRTQTLLLGSHANFREVSSHLIECAERGEHETYIGSLYWRWIAAMRSHEAYEEHKLYPYLAHRWGADFARAEAGHAELHARDVEVREALVNPDDRDALAEALRRHDITLCEHLALEEELVIPLLLELTPEEFDRYASSSIESLLD